MKNKFRGLSRPTWLVINGLIVVSAHAADLTWNGAPGGTWDTTSASWLDGGSPATWNNATPDSAVFDATGVGTVTLASDMHATGITFNTAGYTLAGSHLTVEGALTANADTVITSILTGTPGLTKTGSGRLELTGANDYSGITDIYDGTLRISKPQLATGEIHVNAGTLELNEGANSSTYTLTRASAIRVASGAAVSMLKEIPWGWYANNNANGLMIHLEGGSFLMNNLRQGSFGVAVTFTGGSIVGGGAGARWDIGRSAGYDPAITTLASSTTSVLGAAILQLRPDSGQSNYVFNIAAGTTASGVDLDITGNVAGSGAATLYKMGPGLMRLSGASTYTARTQVADGTLQLGATAVFPSTPIVVNAGAVLDTTPRTTFAIASGKTLSAGRTTSPDVDVRGNLTIDAGGTLNPAGASLGTLTIDGNLTLNGGSVNLDRTGATTDLVTLNGGTLALTGTSTLLASEGYFPAGTYTVANGFSSVTGGAANLAWGSPTRGQIASFVFGANDLQMTLSDGTPGSLTWSGTASGVWDANATMNWNGGTEKFYQLDAVTFADAPTTATVTIAGSMAPASVSFTNATTAYIVRGGTGSIAGAGALTKTGAASVTMWQNTNTYSGGTTINAGTIFLNSGAALTSGSYTPLGGGVITLNGGVLQLNPGNNGGGSYTFPNAIVLNGGTLFEDDGNNRFTGPVTVSAPSVIMGRYGTKDLFLDGGLAGSANLTITDYGGPYGSGAVHLTANGTYDGTITLDASQGGPGHLVLEADNALVNAKIIHNANGTTDGWNNNLGITLAGAATNVTIAGINSSLSGATIHNADVTTRTLTVNTDTNDTYLGKVGDGTANGDRLKIVKSGTGSLMLGGVNTYKGDTVVEGGSLTIPSSQLSPNYDLKDGTSLGVSVVPGTSLVATSLKLGASSGATLSISNFAGDPALAPITTQTVETHGTVTINVSGTFSFGLFPLISYTSITGDGAPAFVLGSLPRGVVAELIDTGTAVNLVVTGLDSLVWTGAEGTEWNVDSTENWSLGGGPSKFLDGDVVRFDDSAGSNTTVNLTEEVIPFSVTVDGFANYTISGAGHIAGSGGITKTGVGTLELSTANTFNGAVTVAAGTLKLGNATALGSATAGTSMSLGTVLDLNGQTVGGESLTFQGSGFGDGAIVNTSATPASLGGLVTLTGATLFGGTGDITLSNVISGAFDIEKIGPGTLTFGSANAGITGNTVVTAGTLVFSTGRTMENSPITVKADATLRVAGSNALQHHNRTLLIESGGTLDVGATTSNIGAGGATSSLVLQGGATLSGATPDGYWGSWTINTNGARLTVLGGNPAAATLSAKNVVPAGAVLTLEVADVTGDGGTDLDITGILGAAANTTFGVTLTGGGTVAFNAVNLNTGATTLPADMTLTGGGTLPGPLTAAGIVAPGNNGAGTLKTGAATLSGTYSCELDGAGSDTLAVTGDLNLTGATLAVSVLGGGLTGHEYVIATYTGTLTGAFTELGVPPGYSVSYALPGRIVITDGTASGFASWIEGFDITDPADKAPDADPDHDGIANALEYVLGGNPSIPGSSELPVMAIEGGNFTFTFERDDASETPDVQVIVQVSDDLSAGSWTDYVVGADTASSDDGIEVTENDTSADTVKLIVPMGADPRQFARLKVVVTP